MIFYDQILEDIGHFGPWHRRLFLMVGLCVTVSTFFVDMFFFEGFIPKFRCHVQPCEAGSCLEDSSPANDCPYLADFTAFALPDSKDRQDRCRMFLPGPGLNRSLSSPLLPWLLGAAGAPDANNLSCTAEAFDRSSLVDCQHHVYDDSEFRLSLVAELDLAPCKQGDWGMQARLDLLKEIFYHYMYVYRLNPSSYKLSMPPKLSLKRLKLTNS